MNWFATLWKDDGNPDESATRVRIDQITLIHPIRNRVGINPGSDVVAKIAFEITVQNHEKPLLCMSLGTNNIHQHADTKAMNTLLIKACEDCVHPHEVDS